MHQEKVIHVFDGYEIIAGSLICKNGES